MFVPLTSVSWAVIAVLAAAASAAVSTALPVAVESLIWVLVMEVAVGEASAHTLPEYTRIFSDTVLKYRSPAWSAELSLRVAGSEVFGP